MANNLIVKMSLDYALSKLDQETIDQILIKELSMEEKINTIATMNEEKIKEVLRKIGFTNEFLKTI